ncbi:MAG TPA: hypothetical protein VKB88_18965 [Bryobacteraceae bacterium]|nr:hypothetical protein [Bryobacteraceae bacterium]
MQARVDPILEATHHGYTSSVAPPDARASGRLSSDSAFNQSSSGDPSGHPRSNHSWYALFEIASSRISGAETPLSGSAASGMSITSEVAAVDRVRNLAIMSVAMILILERLI